MPLIQGKSKKAFSKNVEKEMHAGKPQDQALAIAYSVKRKNAKKKAAGGSVQSGSPDMNYAKGGEIKSAANESRPMPEEKNMDSAMVLRNSAKKPLVQDGWTDRPTERQAAKGMKTTKIKHPKMVPSSVLSARLMDQEDDLMSSMPPGSSAQQPAKSMDEEGPNRQGPSVPALKMKKMARGGLMDDMDQHSEQEDAHDQYPEQGGTAANPTSRIDTGFGKVIVKAKGGMINDKFSMSKAEEDGEEHPAGLEDDNDQMRPPMNDYMSDHEQMLAEGGMAHEMDLQPEPEAEDEHRSSIAAAIMAKKERQMRLDSGDKDMDHAVMMAEGGEILSEGATDSDHSSQVDLARNAEEDQNHEDQLSFDALRKENYSESEGLRQLNQPMNSNLKGDDREASEENEHDMVDSIRRKMMTRRQFRD